MKRIILILILTIISTAIGVYFRPSYLVIGQLNWFDVLTKGYFVGSFSKFFSQAFLDESFYYVMRFSAGGAVAGLILSFFVGAKPAKSKKKK